MCDPPPKMFSSFSGLTNGKLAIDLGMNPVELQSPLSPFGGEGTDFLLLCSSTAFRYRRGVEGSRNNGHLIPFASPTVFSIQLIHELFALFRDVPGIGPKAEVDFPPIPFVVRLVE